MSHGIARNGASQGELFNDNGPMRARVAAFFIWGLVAASAMYWLLRLTAWSPAAPAHTLAVAPAPVPRGDLTRLFGAPPAVKGATAAPAEPALPSRFKLLGVAAPRQGGDREGLALISLDGKPARGYRVGALIDGDWVLQSVHARGAAVGVAGAAPLVKLELPPLPPPSTGRLGSAAPLPVGGVLPPGPTIGTLPIPVPPPPGANEQPQPDAVQGAPAQPTR